MTDFKLYYTTTSCGAANFIVASLAGLNFDSEQVDFATKKTASGADFLAINPKGNVPAIVFPDGSILNENVATLTYLADQAPGAALAPVQGAPERYQYLNALGFVSSELHPRMGTLFSPALDDGVRAWLRERAAESVARFFKLVVDGKEYAVAGDKPTAADIYAYIILSWAPYVGVDISGTPEAEAYSKKVGAFPGIVEAHKAMKDASA